VAAGYDRIAHVPRPTYFLRAQEAPEAVERRGTWEKKMIVEKTFEEQEQQRIRQQSEKNCSEAEKMMPNILIANENIEANKEEIEQQIEQAKQYEKELRVKHNEERKNLRSNDSFSYLMTK
jgi:septal ring factor EnvC (AmiA/AmiB activator)